LAVGHLKCSNDVTESKTAMSQLVRKKAPYWNVWNVELDWPQKHDEYRRKYSTLYMDLLSQSVDCAGLEMLFQRIKTDDSISDMKNLIFEKYYLAQRQEVTQLLNHITQPLNISEDERNALIKRVYGIYLMAKNENSKTLLEDAYKVITGNLNSTIEQAISYMKVNKSSTKLQSKRKDQATINTPSLIQNTPESVSVGLPSTFETTSSSVTRLPPIKEIMNPVQNEQTTGNNTLESNADLILPSNFYSTQMQNDQDAPSSQLPNIITISDDEIEAQPEFDLQSNSNELSQHQTQEKSLKEQNSVMLFVNPNQHSLDDSE